jgi:hypothetical protein
MKSRPHYRYYIEQVQTDYRTGCLTARGAVLMAVRSLRRQGHKLRIQNKAEFARSLGMDRRTLYRAISELKADPDIDFEWEAIGSLDLWIPEPVEPADITDIAVGQNDLTCGEMTTPEANSPHLRRDCHSLRRNDHTCADFVSTTPLQPTDTNGSSPSSDLSQINTDLSQIPPPALSERETLEHDPEFRNWLSQQAAQLPHPPQFLEQWLSKQAKLETNQKDYLKRKGPQTRPNIPPRPPAFRLRALVSAPTTQATKALSWPNSPSFGATAGTTL